VKGRSSPSPGRELWLVRHGETPASRDRKLAGWTDVPLTERGERQAAALRPVLEGTRFAGVWSSDLRRAVTTAHLAWGEPRRDRRLRELSFGELEGVSYATMDARWQQGLVRFEGFAAPGGETFDELHRRVMSFVDELAPGRHLLFTHGGVVRLLAREVGEDGFVPTGTLLVVDWDGRRLLSRRGQEGVVLLETPSVAPERAEGASGGGAPAPPSKPKA
jgi:2,3-bisphosphoglycerate-dependent phosphoglycerate mutase